MCDVGKGRKGEGGRELYSFPIAQLEGMRFRRLRGAVGHVYMNFPYLEYSTALLSCAVT